MTFSNDSPALILNYQTDLNLTDLPALEREVDEIWTSFKVDAEKANVANAIIKANEKPKGFIISTGNAYGFSYHKGQVGQWSRNK